MKTTLKAFANSSPGLRFGNPGDKIHFILEYATLNEVSGKREPTNYTCIEYKL
jgi:hypothetical protein